MAIKDMAGLLTPYATFDLVKAIKAEVDLPLVIHSHSTSGLAPLCQLKAIEAGADRIDTAISSLSSGTSHPATESQVAALKGTDYDTGLNLTLLSEIADYFREVRKKYQQFESEFTREDVSVQISQVPGGMMSNLANQLKEQNALDRIREVFDEIPRVREDLGYPPLVTPTSQIVGTQAVYNVLAGQRYKTITNEVKRYLQGGYGQPPAPVNADVRKKATAPGHVSTAMPGNVVEVLVSEGDTVSARQAVLITEAMKMETEVHANIDGKVEAVDVTKGDRVTPGEVLIEIG